MCGLSDDEREWAVHPLIVAALVVYAVVVFLSLYSPR